MAKEIRGSLQPDAQGRFPMEESQKQKHALELEQSCNPPISKFNRPKKKPSPKERFMCPEELKRVCAERCIKPNDLLGFQLESRMQRRGSKWKAQNGCALLLSMSQDKS